jgi:hypothetical protein
MLQQKFIVQVTTLPDCDDITRFDGIIIVCKGLKTVSFYFLKVCTEGVLDFIS